MTADLLKKVIDGAARKFALNMKGVSEYFVDDYDILIISSSTVSKVMNTSQSACLLRT